MAFGITRATLKEWKQTVKKGKIAFLTHYWIDERFPNCNTVTKVGCADLNLLIKWGEKYQLQPEWIHRDPQFPHFDLFGDIQLKILKEENQWEDIWRFELNKK
ncbi:hypothetical protein [Saliterribacillus persicus]|uniref:Uncharacterized protein n=1 Tax=Saliterribacillus persicus TaxID=930114 RepID=A0A368X705_9BACI|nr:hypothetical protein [Saliterribacillus persicus]RCW63780.1 hypothetical protein DFR57_11659 [Saliterribacillus persicus]